MTFTYTGYCAISGRLFNVQGTGCRGGLYTVLPYLMVKKINAYFFSFVGIGSMTFMS